MGDGGDDLRQLWPRRRFLAAAAATGLVTAAEGAPGVLVPEAGAPGRAEPEPAGPPGADRIVEKPETDLDHLPIHGSPHLLATELPTSFPSTAWTRSDARVLHFHVPRDERDRLPLPLP